jgi:FtsZ-binding cell division protein ZapB
MALLQERLETIEWKVQKLVQKMQLLKKENSQLIEENIRLTKEVDQYKKNKENLEAQFSKTREAIESTQAKGSVDKKKLKEEIDHYINEIDKCIEWLQSM